MRSTACSLLLLALLSSAQAQEAPRGQRWTAGGLRDADHGFEVFSLERGWRLLSEGEAAARDPRAVAGVLDPRGGRALLVVPRRVAAGASLAELSSQAFGELPLVGETIRRQAPATIEARPGHQVVGAGRQLDGRAFEVELSLVRADEQRVFELQVWRPAGSVRPADELTRAFRLLPGEARGRPRPTRQAAGVGWRLKDQRLRTRCAQLEIRAPNPAWTLVSRGELEQLRAPAPVEARLLMRSEQLEVDLVVLRLPQRPGALAELAKRDLARLAGEDLTLAGAAGAKLRREGRLVHARGVVPGRSPGWGLAFAARWDAALPLERARSLLGDAFAAVRADPDPLPPGELVESEVRVASSARFRGGVYEDYGIGLRYAPPALEAWRALLGEQEHRCELWAPGAGLRVRLRSVRLGEREDAAALHTRLIEQLGATVEGPAPGPAGVRASWLLRDAEGPEPQRVLLASGAREGLGFVLSASGLPADVAPVQSALEASLRTLQVGGFAARSEGDAVLEDRRLGYRLRAPEGFAARPGTVPEALRRIASAGELRGAKGTWLALIARCTTGQSLATQAREDEHWLARWRRSGELKRGTRSELAGRPCRHLIVRSPKGQRCDVFVVPGPIRWLVFVGDRAGRPPSETGLLAGLEHLPN